LATATPDMLPEFVLIPIEAIEDPPYDPVHNLFNPFDPAAAHELAHDIDQRGLLHPITLHVIPESDPPRYRRLAGRTRIEAYKLLGRDRIEAKVLDGLSIPQMELVTLMENLVRHNMSGPRREGDTAKSIQLRAGMNRDKAISRAKQLYEEEHPPEPEPPADAEPSAPPNGAAPKPAVEVIAERTHQHPKTVEKQIKRATSFTPEQEQVLLDKEVSLNDQSRLAGLDPKKRAAAVEAIRNNSSIDEAILIANQLPRPLVTPPAEPTAPGKSDESVAPAPTPPPEATPREPVVEEFTDADWLAASPIRDRVVRSYYDFMALAWRRTIREREAFFRSLNRETQALRKEYGDVQFGDRSLVAIYNRALGVEHPHQWKVCGGCAGTGMKDGQPHKDCSGGGFIVGQAPRVKKAPAPPREKTADKPPVTPEVKEKTKSKIPKKAPAKPKSKPSPSKPTPKPAAQRTEDEPADIPPDDWPDLDTPLPKMPLVEET